MGIFKALSTFFLPFICNGTSKHDKTKLLKYDVVLYFFFYQINRSIEGDLSSKKKERLTNDFCIISFLISPTNPFVLHLGTSLSWFFCHGCHEFLCIRARNPFEFLNQKYQPFREKAFINITFFHFERFMPYLERFTWKTVDQPGLYLLYFLKWIKIIIRRVVAQFFTVNFIF